MTYLIVTTIIALIYSFIIFSFLIGWIRIKKFKKGAPAPSSVFTSVIIAVKNEEQNIPSLLNSLANQTIHHADYEIIIINDHSNDNTEYLMNSADLPNLKLLNLPLGKRGKKDALQFGISNSTGDLIITTDADCIHHSVWLETISTYYSQYKPKLIIAPVLMQSKSFFEHLQALDFFSLIASGAGASGIKRPIMCNGANLAFDKKTYEEFQDPFHKSFSSGDDVFLLLNMKRKYRKDIKFLKSEEALVLTKPKKHWVNL
jgi:biofilm PGA synthesis N-glycosyltransferase PgaC